MKAEFSTEEEDASAVVFERTEAARVGLDCLDFTIEPFGDGIGDRVAQVSQDFFQVALEHPGGLDDGFEFAAGGPPEPVFEELPRGPLVAIIP